MASSVDMHFRYRKPEFYPMTRLNRFVRYDRKWDAPKFRGQAPTFLDMMGGKSYTFSLEEERQLRARFARENVVAGSGSGAPAANCLVEQKTPVFPFHIDLDIVQPTEFVTEEMHDLVRFLQEAVREVCIGAVHPVVLCTAQPKQVRVRVSAAASTETETVGRVKSGAHVLWPRILVDTPRALAFRQVLLERVRARYGERHISAGENTWEDVLDKTVLQANGLRMIGAPKAVVCEDCDGRDAMRGGGDRCKQNCDTCRGRGRNLSHSIYMPTWALDVHGAEVDISALSAVEMVELCSVRRGQVEASVSELDLPSAVVERHLRTAAGASVLGTRGRDSARQRERRSRRRLVADADPDAILNAFGADANADAQRWTVLDNPAVVQLMRSVSELEEFGRPPILRALRSAAGDTIVLTSSSRRCLNLTDGGQTHRSNTVYFVCNRVRDADGHVEFDGCSIIQKCRCKCDSVAGRRSGLCRDFCSDEVCVDVGVDIASLFAPRSVDDLIDVSGMQQHSLSIARVVEALSKEAGGGETTLICTNGRHPMWYWFDGGRWRSGEHWLTRFITGPVMSAYMRRIRFHSSRATAAGAAAVVAPEMEVEVEAQAEVQTEAQANTEVVQSKKSKKNNFADELHSVLLMLGDVTQRSKVERDLRAILFSETIESDMDSHGSLVGFDDGVFDCKLRAFRKARPSDYVSMSVGYPMAAVTANIDDEVRRELDAYLSSLFPDAVEREYFIAMHAALLDADTKKKTLWIWPGETDTGKSTVAKLDKAVFGEYLIKAPIELLTELKHSADAPNPHLARARGARVIVMEEAPKGSEFNDATVKALTGGDRLVARRMYGDPFEYNPLFVPVVHTNVVPVFDSHDAAITGRIKIAVFTSRFVDDDARVDAARGVFKKDARIETRFDSWRYAFMSMLIRFYQERGGEIPPVPPRFTSAMAAIEREVDPVHVYATENIECANAHITSTRATADCMGFLVKDVWQEFSHQYVDHVRRVKMRRREFIERLTKVLGTTISERKRLYTRPCDREPKQCQQCVVGHVMKSTWAFELDLQEQRSNFY